jgi:hypothetical protein
MADPKTPRYIDYLPPVFQQGQAGDTLDPYLGILQTILGPSLDPEAPDPPSTVVRKAMAQVIDVLPSLFYPRLSFLFPDNTDDFIPPLQSATDPTYLSGKMDLLNDYFGIVDPPPGTDWQARVNSAVSAWLSDFLNWQAAWVGLACDNNWTLDRKREIVATILPVFRRRGTAAGLEDLLKIFVGDGVSVQDMVAAPPMIVGGTTDLKPGFEAGDPVIGGVRPFSFAVQLTVPTYDVLSPAVQQKVDAIRTVVDREKPVRTQYTVSVKTSTAQLGVYSTVGVDFLLPITGA